MRQSGWPQAATVNVLARVNQERARQEELRRAGKFPYTCANHGLTNAEKLSVLAEEFGEVARHVCEAIIELDRLRIKELQKELIEVAAVAVAWAESLE